MLGLLKVSVSAMLATVRCSDIYCDIPTGVPRCRCYVSVTVEGFNNWEGRGYDDFVPREVTKTVPSGDKTT